MRKAALILGLCATLLGLLGLFPHTVDAQAATPQITGVPAGAGVTAQGGSGTVTTGYWEVEADGQVFNFGDAVNYTVQPPPTLKAPIVGAARTPDGGGMWLVGADGGIVTQGDAPFLGSTGGLVLNQPIVGMAATPDGGGYWLVAADGGIFSFGDAHFYGSTGNLVLNQPIVGMASTPDGGGYWLVARDGGIFAFGDARFYGSTGNLVLNKPVVGMASTPDGNGYWLVATDGGIFSFGDADFFGSTGNLVLNSPITAMSATASGDGYWLEGADGGLFSFGDAEFDGSAGGYAYPSSTVALVAQAPSLGQITAGSVFNGTWYEHGAGLTIGTDGRFQIEYRTYNTCGGGTPGLCDLMIGNLIIPGGSLGGRITSINGDTADTTVSYDPGGASAAQTNQMTYEPTNDVVSYDGFLFCGTNAPAGYCGA
jgi:hypothetical protein